MDRRDRHMVRQQRRAQSEPDLREPHHPGVPFQPQQHHDRSEIPGQWRVDALGLHGVPLPKHQQLLPGWIPDRR